MKGSNASVIASGLLLLGGAACLVVGVGIVAGLGWALVVAGVLAIAAEFLVR